MISAPPIGEVLSALPHVHPNDRGSDWFTAATYYPIYERVGQALRPARVLEIGARLGYSLIAMAHGSRRLRRFWWVDNESYLPGSNHDCAANVEAYFRRFRPDGASPQLRHALSFAQLSGVPATGFDLVHVDGDHSYDGAWSDLRHNWDLGRVVLVDDYSTSGVGAAVRDWSRHTGSECVVFETWQRGLAVFDRTGSGEGIARLLEAGPPVLERHGTP